jgi:hypothetical protein
MESIHELRNICQKPKIESREAIGYNYHGFKKRCDLKISIYFTWILLHLGISANTVTILSGIFCIVGGFLLSYGSIWIVIVGIIFFYIYSLLDHCDGDIARYNKQSSILGIFLDWYVHLLRDAAMFTGLAIGSFADQPSVFIIICGFLSVLTPIFDKSVVGCGWTVISWNHLERMQKGAGIIDNLEGLDLNNDTATITDEQGKKSINIIMILVRRLWRLAISIFQHHWSPLVLIILAITQILINAIVSISFDFRHTLIIYTGLLGPIYVCIRLYRVIKNNAFEDRYKLLFSKRNDVSVRDYFFY